MNSLLFALSAVLAVAVAAEKACPAVYAPVCGEDGNVYSNWCMRENAGVAEAESWEGCRARNHPLCPQICTMEYNPVCASDGKIYATKCVMQSQNCGKMMFVKKMEDCKREEKRSVGGMKFCPAVYAPQCGEDGNVYSNWCVRENAGVAEARSWEGCRARNHPLCPQICTDEYNPVCASDGKIYATKCVMQSQNCGKMMFVKKMDDCKREEQKSLAKQGPCPKLYYPVCGDDGKIYDNNCLLKNAEVAEGDWELCRHLNHPLCPFVCTLEYIPTCGSDGKVYPSKCGMNSANCGKRIYEKEMSFCTGTD